MSVRSKRAVPLGPAVLRGGIPLDEVTYKGILYVLGGGDGGWSTPQPTHVTVTASSTLLGSAAATVDRNGATFNLTNDAANSWVKIQFNEGKKVVPTHVTVQQRDESGADRFHRAVRIDGSNDNSSWTELGALTVGQMVETQGAWNTIPCVAAISYTYLRAVMTATETVGNNYFYLAEIEVFGVIE